MSDKYVAYVGTYTHGSSVGIHLYDVNVEEGTLKEKKIIPVNNSSYLCRSVNGKFLYSGLFLRQFNCMAEPER